MTLNPRKILVGTSIRKWLYVQFVKVFQQTFSAPYPPTSSVPVIGSFTIGIIQRPRYINQLLMAVQCAKSSHAD